MKERLTSAYLTCRADRGVVKIYFDLLIALGSTVLIGLSGITNNAVFCYLALLFLPVGLIYPTSLIPVLMVTSLSSNFFSAAEGIGSARLFALAIVLGVAISMVRNHQKLTCSGCVSFCRLS